MSQKLVQVFVRIRNDSRSRRKFGRQLLSLKDLLDTLRDRIESPAHISDYRIAILLIPGYLEVRTMPVCATAAADHTVLNKGGFRPIPIFAVDYRFTEPVYVSSGAKDRSGTDEE